MEEKAPGSKASCNRKKTIQSVNFPNPELHAAVIERIKAVGFSFSNYVCRLLEEDLKKPYLLDDGPRIEIKAAAHAGAYQMEDKGPPYHAKKPSSAVIDQAAAKAASDLKSAALKAAGQKPATGVPSADKPQPKQTALPRRGGRRKPPTQALE